MHTLPPPFLPRIHLGLSSKLLTLTVLFVMLAEILIYLPSVANFRMNWLRDKAAAGHIAAMVLDAAPNGMVPPELVKQMLKEVGAHALAMRKNNHTRTLATDDMSPHIDHQIDLREHDFFKLIMHALDTLANGKGRYLRLVSQPTSNNSTVELILPETSLRVAMIKFSLNILGLSLVISMITATLVYLSLRRLLVQPLKRLSHNMTEFAANPEDVNRLIIPSKRKDEVGRTERILSHLQHNMRTTLQQQKNLVAIGLAVSKINHELRNLLASAQLMSDRLALIEDPTVKRLAPKIIHALDRAIEYCENTLRFGRARERNPIKASLSLIALADEIGEALALSNQSIPKWLVLVPVNFDIWADREQIFRVILNVVRNARDVLVQHNTPHGEIVLTAEKQGGFVKISIIDNGPGISAEAREHLFEAFQTSVNRGGTGLGLAISAELVRLQGGTLTVADHTAGARFDIVLPERGQLPEDNQISQNNGADQATKKE